MVSRWGISKLLLKTLSLSCSSVNLRFHLRIACMWADQRLPLLPWQNLRPLKGIAKCLQILLLEAATAGAQAGDQSWRIVWLTHSRESFLFRICHSFQRRKESQIWSGIFAMLCLWWRNSTFCMLFLWWRNCTFWKILRKVKQRNQKSPAGKEQQEQKGNLI